jgi:hypothetical protein
MLAVAAALVFFLALIFSLGDVVEKFFNPTDFTILGLLLLALHMAGFGTSYDWRGATRRRYTRRRR